MTVSSDSVYQAVASLRRERGDDSRDPTYIATVPRLGYRLVAKVSPWNKKIELQSAADPRADSRNGWPVTRRATRARIWTAALLLFMALAMVFAFRAKLDRRVNTGAAPPPSVAPQNSIAVLPFLDLREGMKDETFADGITEELIDKLAKIPDMRVSSATASFYFRGKQIPVADIAKSLDVAYVLDGSVRKSGIWVRIDTRLVLADTGYVVWSHSYDQPTHNLLMIQDDIAGKAAKALKTAIAAPPTDSPK